MSASVMFSCEYKIQIIKAQSTSSKEVCGC